MGMLNTTEEVKQATVSRLPHWFRLEPGFRFRYGRDEAVVLGWGGHRFHEPRGSGRVLEGDGVVDFQITNCKFLPPSLCFGYCYKGEWYVTSVDEVLKPGNDEIRPWDA